MRPTRSLGVTMIVAAVVLVVVGVFVLGSLSEPSAVGRVRSALYFIGAALIVVGLAAAVSGVWMLVRRRT